MKLILQDAESSLPRIACEGNMTLLPPTGQGDNVQRLLGPDCFQRMVLFDMSRTDHVDSSGISWLLVVHSRFVEAGGQLVLHSLPPRVRGTFDLLRLTTVLHLASAEPAAGALLTGGQA